MVSSTIGQLIQQGVKILVDSKIENPLLEAQLILSDLLNVDKLYIMTNYNIEITSENKTNFINNINRRCTGIPLQYILGKQEFMSLEFKVNESVLIPRPDTEILIEEIIKSVKSNNEYDILELGTGSGCISVSLAKLIKNLNVYTVDISKDAINTAKENATLNGVFEKINFYLGNMFEPISKMTNFFDFIVSNPPYIPKNMIESLDINVREFEPRLALDGGDDGLDFYRIISKNASKYLKRNGMLFLEIGYDQASDVKKLLKENGFDDIYIVKDLAGHDRVIKARIKQSF